MRRRVPGLDSVSPNTASKWPLYWCVVLTVLFAVGDLLPDTKFFVDQHDYLLFHSVAELISISVSWMVFALAWNLRHQLPNGQILILGIGFFSVSLIDIAHTLSFPGMPDFVTPNDVEKTIFFWLSGRTVAAVSLLLVAVWNSPRWPRSAPFAALAGTAALSIFIGWIGIFHLEWMPRTFIAGEGLTPFKIAWEYILAAAYFIAAYLLYRKRAASRDEDLAWLSAAACVLGLAELFFTLYMNVTDLYNFLGHVYKAIAYLMVYRALFVAGVRAPYHLLAIERLRLRTIVETIPDLVWLKDINGVYLFCNPAFERLFGATEGQIIGKTDRDFVDRSLADFFRTKDTQALQSDVPLINEETLHFASDGYRGVFETTKTRLVDENGAPVGVLGISHDVTESKRIQEELARARDTLEEQVRQRTAQLLEAKEAAEAATQAKANFLANMSHEIRTPLNAVLGMAHLALGANPDPQVKSYVSKILQAGQHLLGIINEILDFSKIDAGKMPVEHIGFDLEAVLRDALDMIAERCSEKGIELAVELPDDVPRGLVGDPLHLRQILVNYLNNAVKFTERGEITLKARVVERKPARVTLRFEVRDTGLGISVDQQKQLFRSFQQGDSSTTRKFGGTGLGLAIAKRLAVAMGGEVGVESLPGAGSTFWFEGTFETRDQGARPGTGSGKPAGVTFAWKARPPLALSLSGRRALLVEDNELNQEVARELLRKCGLDVDIAANGAEALARLDAQKYDVVLMDVQMPVMDGLEATRKIRARPEHAALPIIAMTASVMHRDQEKCAAAGMNDYVAKPIEPEVLQEALARWVKPISGGAAQPAPHPSADDRDDDKAIPPRIEGLDTEKGLRHAAGNSVLYMSLLSKFVARQKDVPAQIAAALDSGDIELARRLAHTLKGVAGNIGALQVQETSALLEQVVNESRPRPEADKLLASLAASLGVVVSAIESLAGNDTGSSASPEEPAGLDIVYEKLTSLLRQNDAEATMVLEGNGKLLEAAFPRDYKEISDAIVSYDYDAALQILNHAWNRRVRGQA